MPNFYGAPEISVQDVSRKLQDGEDFVILDIREMPEIDLVSLSIGNVAIAPLSRIQHFGDEVLPDAVRDRDREVVVMCHHGIRSAAVTAWMLAEGWQRVTSMRGGIDAWAAEIDGTIGTY